MKRIGEIKGILAMHRDELRERFKVKEIGVFGYYVRSEEKEVSDIDILVEFEGAVSLLGLVKLENYLSDLLGIKVDLVPKGDIRPELKERILKEVVYP
ncbi:MAG: nucleotidyltransferase family protein [archaeon]|nr:nucleotidyltransferase family protein [archaeon]